MDRPNAGMPTLQAPARPGPQSSLRRRWPPRPRRRINRCLALIGSTSVGLVWIAYLIGALSLLAGAIACEGAHSQRFTAQAIEALTGDRTPLRQTRWLVLLVGVLLLGGGLALCALS